MIIPPLEGLVVLEVFWEFVCFQSTSSCSRFLQECYQGSLIKTTLKVSIKGSLSKLVLLQVQQVLLQEEVVSLGMHPRVLEVVLTANNESSKLVLPIFLREKVLEHQIPKPKVFQNQELFTYFIMLPTKH